MKEIIEKKNELQEIINEALQEIESIKGNPDLSKEGKEKKIQPLQESIEKSYRNIEYLLNNTKDVIIESLEAETDVDPVDLSSRASLLNHGLVALDNESLLNLYKARYKNPVDRKLVEENIQLRIDASPSNPSAAGFSEKYHQAKNWMKTQSDEYAAREVDLQYIDNALVVNHCNKKEYQGDIESVERVQRTSADHEVKMYESKLEQ